MTVAAAIRTIPTTLYDAGCVMIQVEKTILVFVVGTFVSQAILLWLAYRRRERAVRTRSSVACVTIRDGLLVFLIFSGKRAISYKLFGPKLSHRAQAFLVIIFIWTLHNSPVTTLMILYVPLFKFIFRDLS